MVEANSYRTSHRCFRKPAMGDVGWVGDCRLLPLTGIRLGRGCDSRSQADTVSLDSEGACELTCPLP
jgi:hypothetical protein